jgi:hypothetical protein
VEPAVVIRGAQSGSPSTTFPSGTLHEAADLPLESVLEDARDLSSAPDVQRRMPRARDGCHVDAPVTAYQLPSPRVRAVPGDAPKLVRSNLAAMS